MKIQPMKIRIQQITFVLMGLALLANIQTGVAQTPKYKADIPQSLITPDKVPTELLGDLEFTDGMPSEATVRKTYDFIDLSRTVDAFLNGIPPTSIYAMLEGMKQAGAEPGDLVLWENFGDARTLARTCPSRTEKSGSESAKLVYESP